MDTDGLPSRIAGEIATLIVSGDLPAEAKLNTQRLAERFAVSRTPVRAALDLLETRGLVRQQTNRGYFVAPLTARSRARAMVSSAAGGARDVPKAYFTLAEDWLRDTVPEDVTESFLLERYRLSRAELSSVLTRAAAEGWIERKAGYGWRLLPVAKTPEAQDQLYRMRLILEPAAFLEPTFALDHAALERIKSELERVRDGAHLDWPADRLHSIGSGFHEELMRMSGNPFLHQAVVRVNRMRQLLEYRSMIDRQRVLSETQEHLEILVPLMAGDLVETSFLMRRHVARALERKRPAQAKVRQ
jgi:DNA-binding GntR family transcriptional regulator